MIAAVYGKPGVIMKKIATKVQIGFLIVGLIPMISIATISLLNAENALEKQTYKKLSAVRDIKKNSIEQTMPCLLQRA